MYQVIVEFICSKSNIYAFLHLFWWLHAEMTLQKIESFLGTIAELRVGEPGQNASTWKFSNENDKNSSKAGLCIEFHTLSQTQRFTTQVHTHSALYKLCHNHWIYFDSKIAPKQCTFFFFRKYLLITSACSLQFKSGSVALLGLLVQDNCNFTLPSLS